ncbi:MAG TPA: cupredoxin family copper-binding protein [Xanthobacteraceae bacterium]|nr:cupredoxin family copper-binding protein [Xanthobacteraceae bacterium]
MHRRRAVRIFGALLLALVAGQARAEVIQVKIENLAFRPADVTAHVGDTIEWINSDFIAHTATARDGAWDVLIPINTTRSVVLKTAGMVTYFCKFHPNMTGRIVVGK